MSSEDLPDPGSARPARGDDGAAAAPGGGGVPARVSDRPAAVRGSGGVPKHADDVPMLELTDPSLMRALAHPLRWAILEALLHAGTLTATQAGDLLNETPANCAFHLRTLARYGLVEEAGGGKGRERPWRRVDTGMNLSVSRLDPQAAAAGQVLDQFFVDRSLERARATLRGRGLWPAEWQDHAGQSENIVYLTPDEAEEMQQDMLRILRRFRERSQDPAARPPGALPIEYLVLSYPLLDLASMPVPETPTGEAPPDGEDDEQDDEG
jgi:Helix-turn-helix domain